ncbi:hypothetical protein ACLKA7_015904 [Drosophila subpalustris]
MTTKITNASQIAGLLALSYLVSLSLSDCNVCQTNQAACINSTSYYLCFGDGTPHTDNIFHCLAGFQCSDSTAICIQKNAQRPPSCGDTSKCGLCSAHRNYKFACHARGIFQMCYGASQPTGPYGMCPTGTVCDASSDVVCVPEKPGESVTCDVNDDLVNTTAEPPASTTPDPASQTAQEVCKLKAKSGLYETVPRDPYCKRYIDCYYNKGTVLAVEYGCSDTSYFEAATQRCTYLMPSNCI